jgi:glycoside/pentoside/hexuronide:cation symporter, GPH family
MKVKFGEKVAYALGDFSNNSAYLFVSTYIISFLTIGMGLSGTQAGTIILIVTIFDAINDVVIGSLVDKSHGRGTTYTKIMRMAVIPVAVLMVLLFSSPSFSLTAKIVYALIIYAIYTIAQTSYQVPFGALSSAMTDDTAERISLGAYRDWGANVGSFVVNTFASMLILKFGGGEMSTRGFFYSALVVGILLVIGGMIPAFVCKERVPVVDSQEAGFKEGIKAYVKNRNAVIPTIIVCMVNCALVVRASFTVYYASYALGNPGLISPILSVMSLVPLVGIFFIPALTVKLDRKIMFSLAGVFMILAGIIELLGSGLTASMIGSLCCGFALCCSITVTWGAIPDIADYGEYLTGVYSPSVCYSTLTFVMKAAVAIATYSLGSILDAIGFDANNVTDQAINGISFWYGVFPIIFGIVALISAMFFNLSSKRLEEVHAELAIRHGKTKA